ncbi:MAG: replication factor C large subunit, partial [Candidatus Bathyarchaeota archaeon]|nr:replication factor C large subunit [Candidatus Bathyarchaeota archaeon]
MSQSWTSLYRPTTREDFVGNTTAVEAVEKWLVKWKKNKPPKKRAVFLYGPPGIGKTSIAMVLAKELDFDLIEINASDARNKSTLEEVLGKAIKQNITLFGQRRLILLDEMDGLSGTNDRGGISFISNAIDESTAPMILVANTVKENMEQKFSSIIRKVTSIEFKPLTFQETYLALEKIADKQDIKVHPDVLDLIAEKTSGDLRSAIVDLETISSGKTEVNPEDAEVLSTRDRQDLTPNILNKIFMATSLQEARQTIRQSMISYDDLYDWIYENLPTVIDDPHERVQALETMAKADIYQNRARSYDYRLLKYMFDQMTGGIAFTRDKSRGEGYKDQLNIALRSAGLPPSKLTTQDSIEGVVIKPNGWLGKDVWAKLNGNLRDIGATWVYGKNYWVLPYYKEPQTKWRYIKTYHSRRRMNSVTAQIARHCHTSTDKVRNDILPLLSYMIQNNQAMYQETEAWLTNLQDKKLDHLRYM